MQPSTDPFEILGISPTFDVDLKACEARHRELSRAAHPDKFRDASPAERKRATDIAASANEAWRALRDPIKRAEILFERRGVGVGEGNEPKAAPAFLMTMLEKREALAEARAQNDRAAVERLKVEIEAMQAESMGELSHAFHEGGAAALEAAVPHLGKLRFYRRYIEDVSAIEDEFDGIA